MNGRRDNSPLAPEMLRFRVMLELELELDPVGRGVVGLDASAPLCCGLCSIFWSLMPRRFME
jgi:hypothetical protein